MSRCCIISVYLSARQIQLAIILLNACLSVCTNDQIADVVIAVAIKVVTIDTFLTG